MSLSLSACPTRCKNCLYPGRRCNVFPTRMPRYVVAIPPETYNAGAAIATLAAVATSARPTHAMSVGSLYWRSLFYQKCLDEL